jgi:iron complex outermembrane recepter protein
LASREQTSQFQWLLGGFFFSQNGNANSQTFAGAAYKLFDPNAPYTLLTDSKRQNVGVAGFGQLTYSFTDALKLTLGARYDTERRSLTGRNGFQKDPLPAQYQAEQSFNATFAAFSPKIAAEYVLADDAMLYASFARGFRAGGFNQLSNKPEEIPFQPEVSDNYELGFKSTLWERRIRFNITGYILRVNNQQISTAQDGINFRVFNAGKLANAGVEVELAAVPFQNLHLDWTFSYSNARYEELPLFNFAARRSENYVNNRPLFAPPVTSMLAVQYDIPFSLADVVMTGFVRAEWRHTGEYYFDLYNVGKQSAYSLFNARAGVGTPLVDIAVWVRNLADIRYYTWGSQSPTQPYFMLSAPRTFGVTVTAKF